MSGLGFGLGEQVAAYLRQVGVREAADLAALRAETTKLPMAMMQISPEQGALMQLLVRLIGARRCLEVGVFTGYSALAVALALPDDGRILACDVSAEWTAIGRRHWQAAGIAHKIELRLQPAVQTLDAEIAAGRSGSFDFAFIDADKPNYLNYYERALSLLRPGGLVAIDNVLWHGAVADAKKNDADTVAIRALNTKLQGDQRIDLSMVPIGDGLTLARKR
jgi:predicted O-methyltransferase YrrM